jgi:hypothetical protein
VNIIEGRVILEECLFSFSNEKARHQFMNKCELNGVCIVGQLVGMNPGMNLGQVRDEIGASQGQYRYSP